MIQNAVDNETSMMLLDEDELLRAYLVRKGNFLPWTRDRSQTNKQQVIIQSILKNYGGAHFIGANVFISPDAAVFTDTLSIGDDSWIASGAVVRGSVKIGRNVSVNPFAVIAGLVSIGSDVRIASGAAIYGFNHGHERVDMPIYAQPHTFVGVTIGDDCWIGANAVITDGVTIGSHSIVAANAVVTKSFDEYSVIAGSPGKVIRSRV